VARNYLQLRPQEWKVTGRSFG